MKQPLVPRPADASFSDFLRRCAEEEKEEDEEDEDHQVHGIIRQEGEQLSHSSPSRRPTWTPLPDSAHRHGHHDVELPSSYMTLIPLSDERLKPRPWLMILLGTILVTCLGMVWIYFTVSRGVSVGTIQVVDSSMSFDTSAGSYHILLVTNLPVFNLNYQEVSVQGTITVSFYDQVAGVYQLEPVAIPRRSLPHNIRADINSSSLPPKWIFTVYSQCHVFPSQLIFFLRSDLSATYLRTTIHLPTIEGYAIVDCKESKDGSKARGTN